MTPSTSFQPFLACKVSSGKSADSLFFSILYWLCYYIFSIFPFIPPLPFTPQLFSIPHLSSCLWVIHISSLASTFPTLFLPSPCLFSTYHLCYLFSVPFPPPHPTPLLITLVWAPFLWFRSCSSCLLSFCFHFFFSFIFLGSFVGSSEFVVILLFIFLTLIFFLDKSL